LKNQVSKFDFPKNIKGKHRLYIQDTGSIFRIQALYPGYRSQGYILGAIPRIQALYSGYRSQGYILGAIPPKTGFLRSPTP
jgi:hypothetical protein